MSETIDDGTRLPNGRFQTGHKSISPGRPKGSRQALATAWCNDVYAAWLEHGSEVIDRAIKEDPVAFLKIVASTLPAKFEVEHTIEIGDFAGKFRAALEALHGDDMPVIEAKPLRALKNER